MGKVKHNELPERWLDYKAVGSQIPGTRLAACKVPLREAMLRRVPPAERFGCKDLLNAFPKMGLLVDLTNTTRYYDPEVIKKENIKYVKIGCPGHVIPPPSIVKQFHELVTEFLQTEKDSDSIIVVHCTHGVNRTGYFVCSYMIQQMDYQPEEAMKLFSDARGHEMEREPYKYDLNHGCSGGEEIHLNKAYMHRLFMKRIREEKRNKREKREALGEECPTNTTKDDESQTPMSKKSLKKMKWKTLQRERRKVRQNISMPQFYQPAEQTAMDCYQPYVDHSQYWTEYQHQSHFQGQPEVCQPPPENDQDSGSSEEVKARFSWTPSDYNIPPPIPWARNPNVRVYSPASLRRNERPSRSRGNRRSRGRKRYNQ